MVLMPENQSQLNCDIFIDDLEEIFNEKSFPMNIRKILFTPNEIKKTNTKNRICPIMERNI